MKFHDKSSAHLLYFGALFSFLFFSCHTHKRSGLTPDPICGLEGSIIPSTPVPPSTFLSHIRCSPPAALRFSSNIRPSIKRQQRPIDLHNKYTVLKLLTNASEALVRRRVYRTQETKRGVRQYTCVANDGEKVKLLESRKKQVGANWQRAVSGEIFAVPVISKLVSPPAIKTISFFFSVVASISRVSLFV